MQRSVLRDGYAVGVGCVSATAGAKEGYRDSSRRSPTLTIWLTSIQDKFAKLFLTIAAELWLRGRIDTLETVFQATARNLLFGWPKP